MKLSLNMMKLYPNIYFVGGRAEEGFPISQRRGTDWRGVYYNYCATIEVVGRSVQNIQ